MAGYDDITYRIWLMALVRGFVGGAIRAAPLRQTPRYAASGHV